MRLQFQPKQLTLPPIMKMIQDELIAFEHLVNLPLHILPIAPPFGRSYWTYVHPMQCTQDGRLGYNGSKVTTWVVNNVDNMSTHAEHKLETVNYTGGKGNWNFAKYVKLHKDQHAILEGLVGHGYSGIDACSKVQHLLLKGIKDHCF